MDPARHDVSDIHELSPVQSIRCVINKTGDEVSTLIARTGVAGIDINILNSHPGDAKFLHHERGGDGDGDGEASRRLVGPLDELGGVRGCL